MTTDHITQVESLASEGSTLNLNREDLEEIQDIIGDQHAFDKVIEEFRKKNLIWHFVDALKNKQDFETTRKFIKSQNGDIEGFESFYSSIEPMSINVKKHLGVDCLAYSLDNMTTYIKVCSEESVDMSKLLQDSSQIYSIDLEENTQVVVQRKNDNERHYHFSGSESCTMTINWTADGVKCKIVIEIDSSGIKNIKEAQFGIEVEHDTKKIVQLTQKSQQSIENNKDVYLNDKCLSVALHHYTQSIGKIINSPEQQNAETFSQHSCVRSDNLDVAESSEHEKTPGSGHASDDEEWCESGDFIPPEHAEEETNLKVIELLKKEIVRLRQANELITKAAQEREEKLSEEHRALKQEKKSLVHKLAESMKSLTEQNDYMRQIEEKIAQSDNAAKKLGLTVNALEKKLKDKGDTVQSTIKINEYLKREISKLEAKTKELTIQDEKFLRTNQELEELLAERESKLEGSIKENKQLQVQLQEVQQRLRDAQDETKQLKSQLDSKQEEEAESSIGRAFAEEMEEVESNDQVEKLSEKNQELKKRLNGLTAAHKQLQELKDVLNKNEQQTSIGAASDSILTKEIGAQTDIQGIKIEELTMQNRELLKKNQALEQSLDKQGKELKEIIIQQQRDILSYETKVTAQDKQIPQLTTLIKEATKEFSFKVIINPVKRSMEVSPILQEINVTEPLHNGRYSLSSDVPSISVFARKC